MHLDGLVCKVGSDCGSLVFLSAVDEV
jgi:hypothetical protein